MTDEPDYPALLRAAITAAESSRRKLSFQLAEETGNQQDSEYRALGKYLSGDETPNRERAAIIAVLLKEPKLALVSDAAGRRQDRLAKVEDEVAQLRSDLDRFVRAASERRAELEADQETPMPREARPSSPDSET